MGAMTVLLIGDSHLAYAVRDYPDLIAASLGPAVESEAFGGATIPDLAGQVRGLPLASYDAVVVSIGSNDAFLGWPFRRPLDAFVADHPGVRWVWVASPNLDQPMAGVGPVVATRDLLAPLGEDAYVGDGVHLTRASYEVLLPAIGEVVRRV